MFISYARRDQQSIARLRLDFEQLGHDVWFDRESHGGQDWWSGVLRRVRGCVVFVFAISPDSLKSKACLAELRYARALRRPVLPVIVRATDLSAMPEIFADDPIVDYVNRTPETVISLLKTFNALPTAKPLPARPPREPEIPTSYLNSYLERIDSADLDETAQTELCGQLRDRLDDGQEREEVWDLLVRLRGRPGVTRSVVDELENVLAPGWQPDPRERYEARYWDGQSWTTLVCQNGHEFNDRVRPPQEHAHLPSAEDSTDELPVTNHAQHRHTAPRRRRPGLPWLVGACALALAGSVTGGLLLFGGGKPDAGSATLLARNFVNAVNTRDESALTAYVCGRDRDDNAHLYGGLLDTANVTLESVDPEGQDPRFTILAARTTGTSSVRLSIPLAEENGEWRVCDISRALSGR
ncbi:MAG: TIR domain-containing protein [Actinomycetota bacterium]|nr:TIR domain-containing protein [Actinomycetota bacterium]